MKVARTSFALVLCVAVPLFVYTQEVDELSNWYRTLGRNYDGYSDFDFTRYTKDDIQIARNKFLQIESDAYLDEWEGLYARDAMLGKVELIWSKRHGFVYAYVYHTLANLDYGRVSLLGDSVLLKPEKSSAKKPNKFLQGEVIRVKFGERHLLVARSGLKDFALFAAGLDLPYQGRRVPYTEEGDVWEKVADGGKIIAEVPTFPIRYAHLIRQPIRAVVSSVGNLKIARRTSPDFKIGSGDYVRTLTLSSGSRNGIKVGMTFWIDALEERVEVTSVGPSWSVARLQRPFIDGREFCRNDEIPDGEPFACRKPQIGMRARTKTKYF